MKNKIIVSLIAIVMIFCYAGDMQAQAGVRSLIRSTGSQAGQTRNFWHWKQNPQTSSETAIVPYQFKPQNFPKEGSPLKRLGLPENATQADITAASKRLKAAYHPDRFTNPIDKAKATKISQEIGKITEQARNYATEQLPPKSTQEILRRMAEKLENDPNLPHTMQNSMNFQTKAQTLKQSMLSKEYWQAIKNTPPVIKSGKVLWNDPLANDIIFYGYARSKIIPALEQKGYTAEQINTELPKIRTQMSNRWSNIKGMGHSYLGFTVLGTLPAANNLDFQDDLYNSHMETIGLDDDQLPSKEEQNQEKKEIDETLTKTPEMNSANQSESPTHAIIETPLIDTMNEPLQETAEQIQELNQALDEFIEKTLDEIPDANSIDQTKTPAEFIKTDIIPASPAPLTWWDSLAAGGNYLANSTNNLINSSIELVAANPITTGVIAIGAVLATSRYLYKKYYKEKPFTPSEPIFIDEQESLNE